MDVRPFEDTSIAEQIPPTQVAVICYDPPSLTGEDRLIFDVIHAPPSHANALRRTLLAEVPSMAVDFVTILLNTGVMPDEVLSHRLGLLPLNAEPSQFDFLTSEMTADTPDDPGTTALFGLHIIGGDGPAPDLHGVDSTWEEGLPPLYTGPSGTVLSSHLVFMRMAGQEGLGEVSVMHGNVPITKLNPGECIHLYARAIKGTGAEHAKWSPVATAFYRLVPKIEIDPAIGRTAKKLLVRTCPCNVFEIEELGEIVVKKPRQCTTCRECTRIDKLAGLVRLGKEPNHWEFTVESVGGRRAPELVKEALQVLRAKCERMREAVASAIPE
jgi:DNA-directed RNA polymerase I and III subunit RPAC1